MTLIIIHTYNCFVDIFQFKSWYKGAQLHTNPSSEHNLIDTAKTSSDLKLFNLKKNSYISQQTVTFH